MINLDSLILHEEFRKLPKNLTELCDIMYNGPQSDSFSNELLLKIDNTVEGLKMFREIIKQGIPKVVDGI